MAYTRRDVLQRGALLAGAAGAASIAGLGGIERALAAVSTQLSPAREATYAALVEAVALAGKSDVSADHLDRSTAEFAEIYADATAEMRANTDVVLDVIERGPGGDGFAKLRNNARLKQLRRWVGEDGDKKTPAGGHWSGVAGVAVELAIVPFYPHRGPHEPVAAL